MEQNEYNMEAVGKAFRAIKADDAESLRRVLVDHPGVKAYSSAATVSLLHEAAKRGAISAIQLLLDEGMDVNAIDKYGNETPLTHALDKGQLAAARHLLARGADPNLARALIGAINLDSDEAALASVQLLVEHGADVNRVFPWFDSDDVSYTPLTWAEASGKTTIADYLRSHGAVPPGQKKPAAKAAPQTLADEVIAHFAGHFGPPKPGALIEVVPVEPAIAVHCVPAGDGRDHITLFTTGMSERPMTAPEGEDDYRHAELFIQLPAGWPLTKKALADPKHGWPIRWMRQIAKYPHQNGTWLGGPATLIANDDPPQPLAPGCPFTGWLLLAERDFVRRDGRKIQLYRMTPIYTEERALELRQGIAALLRAFDRRGVPFVVDLKRRNVARP